MSENEDTAGSALRDEGRPGSTLMPTRSAAVDAVLERIETAEHAPPLELLDEYRSLVFRDFVSERPSFTLAWPEHLYIPAQADSRRYWFTDAPADHRYRYDWANTSGGQPAGSHASADDGRLFAWTNVSGLEPGYTGYAGVGARFAPTASLSYVRLGTSVDLVAEHRWWYLPGPQAGYSDVRYLGTVFLAVWEIDPVTGRWELVRPFASRSVLSDQRQGQGGAAVVSARHAFDDLGVTVQLQGGHVYAVGVSFEAQVRHTLLDRDGSAYSKQPGDDVRLWASMLGTVESISISTTTVLVP